MTYRNQVHGDDLLGDTVGVGGLAVVPVGRQSFLIVEEVVAAGVLAGTEEGHHGLDKLAWASSRVRIFDLQPRWQCGLSQA